MEAGAGGGGGACSDASGAPTAAPGAALSVFVKYGLCAALVVLSASQNLLISATETADHKIPYMFVSVTLCAEVSKFLLCLGCMYSSKEELRDGEAPWWKLWSKEGLLYAVPGLLYMIDNNIVYLILQYIDAGTLALLWNTKVIFTALLLKLVLKLQLSTLKWTAIVLLFVGIVTSQADHAASGHAGGHDVPAKGGASAEDTDSGSLFSPLVMGVMLTLIGTFTTAMAGVFTEWVLKRRSHASFYVQNIRLYSFGIIFNSLVLWFENGDAVMERGLFSGWTALVWVIVVVNAGMGLSVAGILKYLDNLAAVFSHVISMLLVVALSAIMFGMPVSLTFVCGFVTCVIAIFLYQIPMPTQAGPATAATRAR